MVLVEERTQTIRNTSPAPDASVTITIPTEERRILDRPGFQLAMGAVPEREDERPPDVIVRGRCPECGEELVSNLYWHTERGYLLRYECWESLMPNGRCRYYAVP